MEPELNIAAVTAAPIYGDLEAYLRHVASQSGPGHTLEFGVFEGRSLQILCGCRDHVTGFDTFTGLPERWDRGADAREAGHFAAPNWRTMSWPKNSTLIAGLFAETLPGWLAEHPGPVGLVHIDSDLYSSARDVLTLLNDRIVPGTVIAFDELCDWQSSPIYTTWQEHEWRALNEWLNQYNRNAEPIARTPRYQAALRVRQ